MVKNPMLSNNDREIENEFFPTLIELHYFPCLEYFIILQHSSVCYLESCENFTKQTYRNRCEILGANKIETLSIPVQKKQKAIRDIRIDYSQNWVKVHWRTITSAYGKSPFFEYYRDDFEKILFKKEAFLFDLNIQILTKCLEFLTCQTPLRFTKKYEKEPKRPIIDRRSLVLHKQAYQERKIYRDHPYQQIFGKKFAGNLSILDLLFCEGPAAANILLRSVGIEFEH